MISISMALLFSSVSKALDWKSDDTTHIFYLSSVLRSYETATVIATKMGTTLPSGNYVCSQKKISNQDIQQVINYFDDRPIQWILKESQSAVISALLVQAGFNVKYSVAAFSLDLYTLKNNAIDPRITVKKIDPLVSLDQWVEIIAQSFSLPISEAKSFVEYIEKKAGSFVGLYIAFWEGIPAAAGIAIIHDKIMSLHRIGTLSEFRRRGLGKALSYAMLVEGRNNGLKKAVLAASDTGKLLYEKLGFVQYDVFNIWVHQKNKV
jgi:ribosomal protein S18 acetylase RimI-like enzyme